MIRPDNRSSLDAHIREATGRQRELTESLSGRTAHLPLRYWRQDAHFTTPAADEVMARKAIEGGTSGMVRILDRVGVSPAELADRLEIDLAAVEALLDRPRRAPLVMLDGEDAQALRDDVVATGLSNAGRLLKHADWAGDGPPTLRFFRPPGFALGSAIRDLYTLLWDLVPAADIRDFSLDGIVFPKIDHPEEVDLLFAVLAEAELALGLEAGRIKVALLVESGWAASRLPEIAVRAASRVSALIFGLADFSADLGLPQISNVHPVASWARAEIVAVAGGLGVPAIDGMTLDYPVVDPSLGAAANRDRFLRRMRFVYDDACQARDLGMTGKWVGHPAQLFAVLLAFEASFAPHVLEAEAAKLEAYRASVIAGRGAAIIEGVMSDRATDRHARVLLRRAIAQGRFDAQRGLDLGVIDPGEVVELERIGQVAVT